MKMPFEIAVSTASGIEAVTKRELLGLGITDAPAKNGRIVFSGDEKTVAACNLHLRTANRVFINLATFKALDFDELYDGVYSVEWQDYIPIDAKIVVSAKCVISKLMALSATQSISKKAICDKIKNKSGAFPTENGTRYKIEISILKDVVTVSLDTTGEGLHRRGYRGLVGEAPLKETLAAALLNLSVWKPSRPLVDLFCGSGTIPIEAALIAKNIPSGYNRAFDFEGWKNFDIKKEFTLLREEAATGIVKKADFRISGYDIDENQIRLAQKHARLAGVEDCIHLQKRDMRDFSSKHKYGVVISNPPYGERLDDRNAVKRLYADFGKVMTSYGDWSVFVLTSVSDFERLYGKKCNKKRKIFNGKLECNYYSFLGEKPEIRK